MKAAAKLQWRKPCANCGHIKTAHDPAKRRTLMPCLECDCRQYRPPVRIATTIVIVTAEFERVLKARRQFNDWIMGEARRALSRDLNVSTDRIERITIEASLRATMRGWMSGLVKMPTLKAYRVNCSVTDRRTDGLDSGATRSRVGSDHRLG
jgi:hypothetical protein